jgi:hypothetical protein
VIGMCATALAGLVALVFATAAVFKLGGQREAIQAFVAMGFVTSSSSIAARFLFFCVIGTEIAVAAALIVVPPVGAVLGFGVLGAFTVVLARTAKRHPTVRCACFGAASQRPIGLSTYVRNGLLMLGLTPGLAQLVAGRSLRPEWGIGSLFFAVGAGLGGFVLVQLVMVAEDARARASSGLKAAS